MRPILKSVRYNTNGTPLEYIPYGSAKPELIHELGHFCSFCEKRNTRSAFHVEHIHGKKCLNTLGVPIYAHLEFRWDNFLIGCVNCNSVKGNKDVVALDPFLPHINNLVHFIKVTKAGVITIRAGVSGNDLVRTKSYIDLIGLDRRPGIVGHSSKDDRWEERMTAYELAERYYKKYTAIPATTDIEDIVNLAKGCGFFSAWYEVFGGEDVVINALLNGYTDTTGSVNIPFPATYVASFNVANHYSTIPRP